MILVFISLVLFSFSINTTTLTQAQCLPDQRHALIQLKQGFHTTELHSWNASIDCCIWDGITCDEKTGMVIALNLPERHISGKLNSALFNLTSLRYLNLAHNNFNNILLPQTGFERLGNLTHLDLSYSGFLGQVPIGFSALTNLISLNLKDISNAKDFPTNMYLNGTSLKTLLSNLTKLEVLRLDGFDISLNGAEWGKAVFQVGPTLQMLSMSYCGLKGSFPYELFDLTNLTELDLSGNLMLSGQLPKFRKQSFLKYLSLAYTNFTGTLPDSIGNLQYILELSLYNCNFYGEIPLSITNLTRLEYLNLEYNRLTSTIPMSLFSHPSLEYLILSYNQLSGYLPEFSNGSSILIYMYLHNNNLQGQLSISRLIKHNKYLHYLDLSNIKLSIVEGKSHNESFYASFSQLEYLALASCDLIYFPTFLSYQKNIDFLDLSDNSITGEIPLSICNVTLPTVLDLSYNNLIGTVPPCLLEDIELEELNLKSNKLNGPLPRNISKACALKTITLNGNVINGSLPKLLKYCHSLEVLDMGNNQILDRFPDWLANLENLRILILRSNMFFGKISDMKINSKRNDSFYPMLKVMDLSSNNFGGTLPTNIIVNLKAMIGVLNTSSLFYYHSMNLSDTSNFVSVPYKGLSYDLIESLGILCYFDLSNNKFCGRIPEEIGQLKSLDVLNLSHNALIGPIPQKIANLQHLQLLDLSSNQLSGQIPQEMTSLTFLSELNLSYNNLVGEIPEVHQFSTFSNASYLGNPGLCGSPLTVQCRATSSNNEFNTSLPLKSSIDTIGLSVSIGLGLGVGFASVIWATISWENGRKWFNFIIDRLYFQHFY